MLRLKLDIESILLKYKDFSQNFHILQKYIPRIETAIKKNLFLNNISKKKIYLLCILVSKEYIYKINHLYRNKNSYTDVVTFSYANITLYNDNHNFYMQNIELDYSNILGEIYVCYEIAKQQSQEINMPIPKRMIELIVHGIFHASGLDHENSIQEELFMHSQEKKLIQYISNQHS